MGAGEAERPAAVDAVERPSKNLLTARMLLRFRGATSVVRGRSLNDGPDSFHFRLEPDVVIPFVLNRKRLDAMSDRMIGKRPNLRLPVRIGGIAGFVITAEPTENSLAVLFGVFNRIVNVHETGTGVHEFLDFLHMFVLDDGMSAAAVHEKDHGLGAFKCLRVFWPAVAGHDWKDTDVFLKKLHQDRAAGKKFMFARTMTWSAGHQDNLGEARIGRLDF